MYSCSGDQIISERQSWTYSGKNKQTKISLKKPQNFGLSVLQMTPRHLRVVCLPMYLTCATYLKQLMVQNLRKLFAVEVLLLMVPLERAYSTMLS